MEKRPERTRQVLISAAADLIADGRFADAGLANICRTAGVSRGALYHHFGSIAELVAGVYEQASERVDGLFEEAFEKSATDAPAEFSITLGAALLDERLVRAGVRIGPSGTDDPPRLREEILAKLRERVVADGSSHAKDIDCAADLAVVVTAGLESLGHADAYWWQPKTARRIWDIVQQLDQS
ncbi:MULTISPECIES: TetR/AcrR family transcriptional regulator [Streptomyces]|uniref:PgaR4 n=1 Tax=Streptomyces sp. PGA64 TaxID=161235 RepID=X5D5I4_9ACTN|nr:MULTISPECIES: TetR/AcrR family transcriptional regulator [unclassified Streptomyces]AHW57764.1 PgaR4 [Streptomyces sp. PGA64]OKJ11020.1 TetR family transcriptional regulator [Streptomyces sp. TSRI0261]QNQ33977.1 TetR/AcrR family transcriptional regulator [Streptomyces sp. CB00271]